MMTKTIFLLSALLAPLAFSQVSCTQLECGPGTTEKDGQCVLPNDSRPDSPTYCGEGTHYDDASRGCISDLPPTVCEEDTTIADVGPDGVTTCVGIGGVGGCDIACPSPDPGKISVCGWLRDAETDDLIGGMGEDGSRCDPLNRPATGACAIEVDFYDALMFAGNPTGTPALEPDELVTNNCGRFTAKNLPAPALGFLAIGVDDGTATEYLLGGVAIPSMANLKRDDLDVYAVRTSSDTKWSESALTPFGSFHARGAYLGIFTHRGVPVEGVVITENGSPQPSEDYYFDDTDPFERTNIDSSRTSTGPNGSGILVDSALVNHSGQGSEGMLEGCMWPTDLGDAIPGVYFVHPRHSEDAMGDVCE
jgi:hypothetical protein